MTASDRFDSQLEGWLRAEAATPAPVDLHGAAIDRARRSRQRPGWLVGVRGTTFDGSSWTIDLSRHRVAYGLIAVALLLVLLGAAILAGAFRTEPTKLPVNGAIAYSVADGAGLRVGESLRLIEPDGTGDRRIASGTCPRFASGRSVLAYATGSFDLATVVITDGAVSASNTAPGLGRSDYALSPDGTRIAWFQNPNPGNNGPVPSDLWVRNVAGGEAVRILPASTNSNELYSSPVWSPDGRQIAFARSYVVQEGAVVYRASIELIDADGSDLHALTNRISAGGAFSWSPDGRWIAFIGLPDLAEFPVGGAAFPAEDVFVAAADGTSEQPLTRTATDEAQPAWSPDGSHLAFLTVGQQAVLTTVRMTGSTPAVSPAFGPTPDAFSWSPDGTKLVLLTQTIVGTDLTGGTISTIDADLRTPPTVVRALDSPISCSPTWQRLDQ